MVLSMQGEVILPTTTDLQGCRHSTVDPTIHQQDLLAAQLAWPHRGNFVLLWHNVFTDDLGLPEQLHNGKNSAETPCFLTSPASLLALQTWYDAGWCGTP